MTSSSHGEPNHKTRKRNKKSTAFLQKNSYCKNTNASSPLLREPKIVNCYKMIDFFWHKSRADNCRPVIKYIFDFIHKTIMH